MAKLLYSATMSLDGYIAGPDGDASWLTPYLGPNPLVDDLVGRVGSLLVGNRTFRGDDPYRDQPGEGEPFGGGWSGPQVVLTHHVPGTPFPGVTFCTSLDEAVSQARSAAGAKEYVNVLGAATARQCLQAGVLDEVLVCVAPILLGDGTPLFRLPGGASVPLQRLSLSDVPHAINAWYRVVR
jgi:dihydrofolate reductase